MSQRRYGQIRNRLLDRLPHEEYERIHPHLEHTSFKLGETIYRPYEQIKFICFPTSAIVSILYLMENGTSAEIGVTGNDGLIGVPIFLGGYTAPNQAVIQRAGEAFRMKAKLLRDEFLQGGMFQRLLLLYTQALITQISLIAVCNRFHSVEQQLCRWLLSHDPLESDELFMTQELIASMLGVRRESITQVAHILQTDGVISYVRGSIKIMNRVKLEAKTCECYKVIKSEYDRLFV